MAQEQTLKSYCFHISRDLNIGEKHIYGTIKLIFDSMQHFTTLSFHFRFRYDPSGPKFPFTHRFDETTVFSRVISAPAYFAHPNF